MIRQPILLLALFTLCFSLSPCSFGDEGNAAAHYLKAMELMNVPDSEELGKKMIAVMKEGWKGDNPDLETLLENNTACLEEVRNVLYLDRCDFTFGKEYIPTYDKRLLPINKVRPFTTLLVLRARYAENQGDSDEAIVYYRIALAWARHMATAREIVYLMLSVAIQDTTWDGIRDLLKSDEITADQLAVLVAALDKQHTTQFLRGALTEGEKDLFLSYARSMAAQSRERFDAMIDGTVHVNREDATSLAGFYYVSVYITLREVNQSAPDDRRMRDEKIRAIAVRSFDRFYNSYVEKVLLLTEKYYGLYNRALRSDNQEDWDTALRAFEGLVVYDSIVDALSDIAESARQGMRDSRLESIEAFLDYYSAVMGERYVNVMLRISLPNFRKAAELYDESVFELDRLRTFAKNRLNQTGGVHVSAH